MANKLKSSKAKTAETGQLKPEKEETVEVKKLLKDERTHKIAGSILLLLAFIFFIAFTSYLFTWGEDQDKFSYRMLLANDIQVQNLLGTFGAFISEIFIRHGFGIAAYLLCTTFFVLGINLFFGKKVFSVFRNIKYLVVGLPVISVAVSALFSGNPFPWGGAAGDMMRDWLYKTIGEIGTIALLAVTVLSYIIWQFNPAFRLPAKKTAGLPGTGIVPAEEEISEKVSWEDPQNSSKGNSVKDNGAMLPVEFPVNPALNHDINLVEKAMTGPEPRTEETLIIPQTVAPDK
ncbi:MAG: DNA translocase FtsK 4TM domain-containing protein, partial [Ferruginibacter sp.]